MKHEEFECDGCGKTREIGPDVVGWFDMAEVVLASRKDQPRWQFCSPICVSLFALSYSPAPPSPESRERGSLLDALRGASEELGPQIGQYL